MDLHKQLEPVQNTESLDSLTKQAANAAQIRLEQRRALVSKLAVAAPAAVALFLAKPAWAQTG